MNRFDLNLLDRQVRSSIEESLARERYLLQIDVNERSITHKVAEHLHASLIRHGYNLDVDCEYNRHGDTDLGKTIQLRPRPIKSDDTKATTVYPDIIVHKRGIDTSNLVVVEAKKSPGASEREDLDLEKLRQFKKELGYKLCYRLTLYTGRLFDSNRLCRIEELEQIQ